MDYDAFAQDATSFMNDLNLFEQEIVVPPGSPPKPSPRSSSQGSASSGKFSPTRKYVIPAGPPLILRRSSSKGSGSDDGSFPARGSPVARKAQSPTTRSMTPPSYPKPGARDNQYDYPREPSHRSSSNRDRTAPLEDIPPPPLRFSKPKFLQNQGKGPIESGPTSQQFNPPPATPYQWLDPSGNDARRHDNMPPPRYSGNGGYTSLPPKDPHSFGNRRPPGPQNPQLYYYEPRRNYNQNNSQQQLANNSTDHYRTDGHYPSANPRLPTSALHQLSGLAPHQSKGTQQLVRSSYDTHYPNVPQLVRAPGLVPGRQTDATQLIQSDRGHHSNMGSNPTPPPFRDTLHTYSERGTPSPTSPPNNGPPQIRHVDQYLKQNGYQNYTPSDMYYSTGPTTVAPPLPGVTGPPVQQRAKSISPNNSTLPYHVTPPAKHGEPSNAERKVEALTKQLEIDEEAGIYGVCHLCGGHVKNASDACQAMGCLYHNKCFTCWSCGRTLRGKAFYNVNNKVYCEEDYLYSGFQQTADKCSVCDHLIMETILQAMGKSYHPGCFRCVVCCQCLDGIPFTIGPDDKVYCIKDYHRRFAPNCAACGKPILPTQGDDETVRVMSMKKLYHTQCYRCEDCGLLFSENPTKHCVPIGKHLFCEKCHSTRYHVAGAVFKQQQPATEL